MPASAIISERPKPVVANNIILQGSTFEMNEEQFGRIKNIEQGGLWLKRKQIYMISYPTGKIYIGKDAYGSSRYFGSPNPYIINEDFEKLPDSGRKDYTVRKQILWESIDCTEAELSAKEVEFINLHQSNNPDIGYNRWPKFRL